MSSPDPKLPDPKLKDALAKSGSEHQPPYAWQEQVWRKMEQPYLAPSAPKRPFYLSWRVATVTALVLFVGGGLALHSQNEAAKREASALAMDSKLKRLIDEYEQDVARAQFEVSAAQKEVDYAFTMLENAVDEKSREEAKLAGVQARQMLKSKQARLESIRIAGVAKAKSKMKAKARKEKRMIDKCAQSQDPLCGL